MDADDAAAEGLQEVLCSTECIYDSADRSCETFWTQHANLIDKLELQGRSHTTYRTVSLHDPEGKVLASQDTNGNTSVCYYDGRDLLVRCIDPQGNQQQTTYDRALQTHPQHHY